MSLPSSLSRVRRRWWVLGLVVVLAGAGGWLRFGPEPAAGAESITSTVTRGTYKSTVSATGTITPTREEDLSFTSSGVVTAVAVAVGDKVQKGDVLATIDDTALLAQRDAAEAQVSAARTQLAEDGSASAAQVAADEASLAAAESQLASAQEAVDNATLTAPFAGTISAVGVEVGDQAGSGQTTPASTGGGATSAVTLISAKKLLVEANVSAADVSRLKKGMQAEITPTGGGEVVYGTVTDIGVIATASDTGAAQFPVTVAVTGTPSGLYPGSSAAVVITTEQATDVLTVPTQALRTDDDGTYVYVVEGSTRTRRAVTIGTAYGMQTEVLTGLAEGDTVEVLSFTRPTGSGNDRGDGGTFELPGGGQFGVPPGGAVPGGGPVVRSVP